MKCYWSRLHFWCYSKLSLSCWLNNKQTLSVESGLFGLKGATSQVAGSPAVLDQTVIVLDWTDTVLDRIVITICGVLSFPLARRWVRLWVRPSLVRPTVSGYLHTTRHTSTLALPTLSCLSGDGYVYRTLPRAVLFPGARSCAFNWTVVHKLNILWWASAAAHKPLPLWLRGRMFAWRVGDTGIAPYYPWPPHWPSG